MNLFVIAGFLGSGKTTSLLSIAKNVMPASAGQSPHFRGRLSLNFKELEIVLNFVVYGLGRDIVKDIVMKCFSGLRLIQGGRS